MQFHVKEDAITRGTPLQHYLRHWKSAIKNHFELLVLTAAFNISSRNFKKMVSYMGQTMFRDGD